MSQVQKNTIAQPLGAQRTLNGRAGQFVTAAIGIAAGVVATILLLMSLNTAPAQQDPASVERPTVNVPADAYQYPH